MTESSSESPSLVSTRGEERTIEMVDYAKRGHSPRLRNSLGLDFFIAMNRRRGRLEPIS